MVPRQPFKWVIIDFVVSCLFLGIPYLFYERTRWSSRIDEESGGFRYATPTLVVGACTCLVVSPYTSSTLALLATDLPCRRKAAIVLSASVTFLSLPGLDTFSRTTGMVGLLFAAFSMAATVVAIFRFKSDLERPISHIGIEGMMVISVCVALVFAFVPTCFINLFFFFFDIEANCYFISATCAIGLFHPGVYDWDCVVLV